MKKLILILAILAGGSMFCSSRLFAQATEAVSAVQAPDEKLQKKLDQTRVQLGKDSSRLLKDQARYDKEMAKYEKRKAKGDLSPNDITKADKRFKQDLKNIEKLKKRINDNQAFLDKYKQ